MFLFSMQLTIMFSDPLDFGFGKISFVYISRYVSGFGIAPLPNNHQIATANAYRVFTLLTNVGLIVIFLTVYFAGFCLMQTVQIINTMSIVLLKRKRLLQRERILKHYILVSNSPKMIMIMIIKNKKVILLQKKKTFINPNSQLGCKEVKCHPSYLQFKISSLFEEKCISNGPYLDE